MRADIVFAIASCLLLVDLGCSKKADPIPVTTTKTRNAPVWIDNPGSIGGASIAAVGSEKPNIMGDLMLQRKVAIAAARMQIAQQLSVRVQGLFGTLTEQYKTAAAQGGKVVDTEAMSRMVSDTNREIVNVALSGVAPREFWTDTDTKYLWVLVVLDKDSSDRAIKASASSVIQKEINKGNAGLQDALDRLDAAIASQK